MFVRNFHGKRAIVFKLPATNTFFSHKFKYIKSKCALNCRLGVCMNKFISILASQPERKLDIDICKISPTKVYSSAVLQVLANV